jgi:hypothetical protein
MNLCKFTIAFCLQLIKQFQYFNYLPTSKIKALAYLLFTIYFIILCIALTKIKFVTNTNLGNRTILLLFSLKVLAGVAVGIVSIYYYKGLSDYTGFNETGMVEYNNLIHKPKIFFLDLFISNYGDNYGDFFGTKNSHFNDLRGTILTKALAFMNILSSGNYYINSLFFNFFGFLGHIALFKIFNNAYPNKKWLIIVGCFLLPSTLYYSSGIHKDLVVFTALSLFCCAVYFGLENTFTINKMATLIISFFVLLLMRNFVAILLLPVALTWFYSRKNRFNPLKTYGIVFALLLAATLVLHFSCNFFNPLQIVINKQRAFLDLGISNTQYVNDTLQNTVTSFIKATPKALRHSFLSPYPTEFKNIFLQFLSMEVVGYLLLLGLFFMCRDKKTKPFINPFTLFCFAFVFLVFLFIGYITPNAGTLVRYRSIYLPFIITPIICSINWELLLNIVIKKKAYYENIAQK